MKNSIFVKDNQLEEWVEGAGRIQEGFGIQKALGYLIGEKFYYVMQMLYDSVEMIKTIEEKRQSINYNPIKKEEGEYSYEINFDERYEQEKEKVPLIRTTLNDFSALIKNEFSQSEIKGYFDSHPRLGTFGHVFSEEEHAFFAEHGAVEHSIDTEVKDAMIFGDIMKYLCT